MTNEQLNEALAKWAGWRKTENETTIDWISPDGEVWRPIPPNYCRDLNAMATLEARFKAGVSDGDRRWSTALMRGIQDELCCGAIEARYKTATATARQRAEALARTVGVWKEEE